MYFRLELQRQPQGAEHGRFGPRFILHSGNINGPFGSASQALAVGRARFLTSVPSRHQCGVSGALCALSVQEAQGAAGTKAIVAQAVPSGSGPGAAAEGPLTQEKTESANRGPKHVDSLTFHCPA